jgi:hypothetical protein
MFEFKSIQVWVDETTALPLKYSVIVDFAEQNTYGAPAIKMTINTEMNIVKTNSVKSIKAPKKTKTLDQMIETIFGESLTEARAKGTDAAVKANTANLRAYAEIHYDNKGSYKSFCESNDAKNTFDDIRDLIGMRPDCTVSSNGQAYAITSELTESDYFCIDNTGASVTLSKKPAKGATSCR